MGVLCGAGSINSFGTHEFTLGSSGARVVRSVDFCLIFRRLLFVILSSFCWTGVWRMHHILHEEENMYQLF